MEVWSLIQEAAVPGDLLLLKRLISLPYSLPCITGDAFAAMALAIVRAARFKPHVSLGQAISDFNAVLSDDQKERVRAYQLKTPAPSAVFQLTAEIDKENSSRRGRCVGPRLTSLLESIQQFTTVVDVFVAGSQSHIAGAIWGGVKLALMLASNFSTYFEKLSVLFMDIGRTSPRYNDLSLLYPTAVGLQRALCDYFAVVVRLCTHTIESLRRPFLAQATTAMLKPFDADFKNFKADLERLAKDVQEERSIASIRAQAEEARQAAAAREQASAFMARSSMLRRQTERDQTAARASKKRRARLRLLASLSSYNHQIAWKHARKKGNSTWMFTNHEYLNWKVVDESCTLWCSGSLGSGKTVLSANVVEDLMVTDSRTDSVSYFFCRYDDHASLKARTILGSIARQLLDVVPGDAIPDAEQIEYDMALDSHKITDILLRVLPPTRQYFVLIDGIDECNESETQILIESLSILLASPSHLFKLYCSSRPDVFRWARKKFEEVRYVSMTLADMSPDIARYIESELYRCLQDEELTIGDPELIMRIKTALLDGAQGMFLWVYFQIQSICTKHSDEEILNALDDLPKSLPETFERVLRNLGSNNSDAKLCLRIFQWLAVGKRPLALGELREAIGIEPCQDSWVDGRFVNDMLRSLSCCGSLVSLDEEQSTVHFTHYTVKQYLLSKALDPLLEPYHFDLPTAQVRAGQICVTYLSLGVFNTQLRRAQHPGLESLNYPTAILHEAIPHTNLANQVAMLLLRDRKGPSPAVHRHLEDIAVKKEVIHGLEAQREYCFLPYAQKYWLLHTKNLPHGSEILWDMWIRLISCRSDVAPTPWSVTSWNCLDDSVIRWTVKHNHAALFFALLSKAGFSVKHRMSRTHEDPRAFRRIVCAIFQEQTWDFARILLRSLTNPSMRNEMLYPIVYSGNIELLAYSFDHQEDCEYCNDEKELSHYGIDFDNLNKVVKKFFQWMSLRPPQWTWTPLRLAAAKGNVKAVVYMLSSGRSELPLRCSKELKHLSHEVFKEAAIRGHDNILLLLLGRGHDWIDIEWSDTEYGLSPLLWAVASGCVAAVRKLIDMGSDITHMAYGLLSKPFPDSTLETVDTMWIARRMGRSVIEKMLLAAWLDNRYDKDRLAVKYRGFDDVNKHLRKFCGTGYTLGRKGLPKSDNAGPTATPWWDNIPFADR
ncbi:hypothetical protein MMC11_002380 [Xylographa trunciseda]|nr:hypothetical protein [Xylographa trunciseda]